MLAPLLVLLLLWVWLFFQEGRLRTRRMEVLLGRPGHVRRGIPASGSRTQSIRPVVFVRAGEGVAGNAGHTQIAKRGIVRWKQFPLFLWAMEPLDGLPYAPTAWVAFGVVRGLSCWQVWC